MAAMAAVKIAAQFASDVNAVHASIEAEKAAKQSAEAQIAETERQAAEVRAASQEERSDRSRQADQELAALTVAMSDGGGLGTINLLRLGGQIGADEGRDLARSSHNEQQALGALASKGLAAKREYQAYKVQARSQRRQIVYSGIASSMGAGLNVAGSGSGGGSGGGSAGGGGGSIGGKNGK